MFPKPLDSLKKKKQSKISTGERKEVGRRIHPEDFSIPIPSISSSSVPLVFPFSPRQ
jgi:hypothetical protein